MPGDGQNTNANPQRISEEMFDHLVVTKEDGREVEKPLRDVIRDAQKKVVAEKRFQEASVKEQAAESAMQVLRDLKEGREKGDVQTLARAFRNAGWSEEDINAMFEPTDGSRAGKGSRAADDEDDRGGRQYGSPGGDDDEQTDEGNQTNRELLDKVSRLENVVETLTKAYEGAKENAKVRNVQLQVSQAVESDAALSRILRTASQEDREWILELARSSCNKASKTLPWGPRAIQAGLEDLKRKLKAIGAGRTARPDASDDEGTSDDGDGYLEEDDDLPGLGPSSTSGNRLHQVSSQGKRVSVRDEGYAQRVRNLLSGALRRSK